MNPVINFPASKPELKLASHPSTSHPHPLEDRRRLEEDIESLRQRETNLREYEARLRSWQERLEQGPGAGSAPQFPTHVTGPEADFALNAAWEKLIRARELLEAEQAHLRDDRLTLREANAALKRREDALALREARLAQREEQLNAALQAAIAEEAKPSALSRLTQAPFALAKSVFGANKPKSE
ncbi:MAG: hypothetical protein JSR48_07405 [Verrucomicrobia bacterium]|nr:hypothetical protein [Verrucomicrobiota bacterium]